MQMLHHTKYKYKSYDISIKWLSKPVAKLKLLPYHYKYVYIKCCIKVKNNTKVLLWYKIERIQSQFLCTLLLIDHILRWQRILLASFSMPQFTSVKVLNTWDELSLTFLLFDDCKYNINQYIKINFTIIIINIVSFLSFYTIKACIPLLSGKMTFSVVVVCFIEDLSKCSTPLKRFWCVFSCCTAICHAKQKL